MCQKEFIVHGRKYGGVACLWNTSITHNVKPFKCDSKRICRLVNTLSGGRTLFIVNAYLSCDNYYAVNVEEDFRDTLNDIKIAIEGVSPDNLILGGDLNIDLQCDNAHSKYIEDMCERHQVKFRWQRVNANPEPTFVNSDGRIN